MDKSKQTSETAGNVGALESSENWIKETDSSAVQNPNQNNQVHKQGLGRNARR